MKYLLFLAMLFPHAVLARSAAFSGPGSAAFLASACQEYIELYNKKDDERFGAFLTTSQEEGFRAGYCLGALLHLSSRDYCGTYAGLAEGSIYSKASSIANNTDFEELNYQSEDRLIEEALCR
ncbi:hypothetical protein [Enterovibrio baiacu]|uniref:hypothetical protein n=1 Tax=Enterovibrio baiacu TaxID=2491023 RepID=UPI001011922E|nr:hypothetical protein [Enterovibrio baiacu]MBE1275020.1 hypothetical protein [Enterovibrio baiacu]